VIEAQTTKGARGEQAQDHHPNKDVDDPTRPVHQRARLDKTGTSWYGWSAVLKMPRFNIRYLSMLFDIMNLPKRFADIGGIPLNEPDRYNHLVRF
jgi:hypothetical protein